MDTQKPTINPKWHLLLHVIKEVNKGFCNLRVDNSIFENICYILTREGVNLGFAFRKGLVAPYSCETDNCIAAFISTNLLFKQRRCNNTTILQVAEDFVINKNNFSSKELDAAAKTIDLFLRLKDPKFAESVITVLYAYDQLARSKVPVVDKDIYDYVVEWKPCWETSMEFEISNSINCAEYHV